MHLSTIFRPQLTPNLFFRFRLKVLMWMTSSEKDLDEIEAHEDEKFAGTVTEDDEVGRFVIFMVIVSKGD